MNTFEAGLRDTSLHQVCYAKDAKNAKITTADKIF